MKCGLWFSLGAKKDYGDIILIMTLGLIIYNIGNLRMKGVYPYE
jgi:hypothetical protein